MEIKKILTRENRTYFWSSGDLNTEFGLVKEKDIKKSKDRVFLNSKNEFKIFDASFTDKISKIKRGPAVILPKDIGLIITSTGINKNSKVLDAGTGSGVLSSYLSNFCKTVYSYEINREFYELAKKNFSDLNIKNIILKNKSVKDISEKDLENHLVLVGAEQMGSDILEYLKNKAKETGQSVVVVDFNPQIVESLVAGNFNVVFGDISDPEVLEELNLSRAKLIITTIPDLVDNTNLIKFAKEKGYEGPIICASYWLHDAVKLYEAGADLVVVPEDVGGKHVARVLSDHWDNLKAIKKAKSKRFEELVSRKIF